MNQKTNQVIESILLEEAQKLINEGYDGKIVEQSLADFATGGIGSIMNFGGLGITQTIKSKIFGFFLAKMGVDPNSFVGLALTNTFANLSVGDYYKAVTDCDFTTKLIAKSILESFIDQMRNTAGMDSFIMSALKDTFVEAAEQTPIYQNIASKLTAFVCPALQSISQKFDLSPLLKVAD
jgi:hypothetical protein